MWERLPGEVTHNKALTVWHRSEGNKQLRKGKSRKLTEVTATSRHPREGRPELDGQVVRQKQGEG